MEEHSTQVGLRGWRGDNFTHTPLLFTLHLSGETHQSEYVFRLQVSNAWSVSDMHITGTHAPACTQVCTHMYMYTHIVYTHMHACTHTHREREREMLQFLWYID